MTLVKNEFVSLPKEIRKMRAEQELRLPLKIAILGDASPQIVAQHIEYNLLKQGVAPSFYFSEFGKFVDDALSPSEKLTTFQPQLIFLLNSERQLPSVNLSENSVLQYREQYHLVWEKLYKGFGCDIVQTNFELPALRPRGNSECVYHFGKTRFVNELNKCISDAALENRFLHVLDVNYLSAKIGHTNWKDDTLWYSSKMPCGMTGMESIGKEFSRICLSLLGKSKKTLVTDLDDTWWGGIVGDDGFSNLKMGNDTPIGEAHHEYQSYVKVLYDTGVAIAIASKNDEKIARQALNQSESALKFDDFSCVRINWSPKHLNIQEISEELNLGMDSLVFVDDNPAERNLVEEAFSDVEVVQTESNEIQSLLCNLNSASFFELTRFTDEDTTRTENYKVARQQKQSSTKFKSHDEFLASLKMQAGIISIDSSNFDRPFQLLNKTNQFNTTGLRLSKNEFIKFLHNPKNLILSFTLLDKFTHHGQVSTVLLSFDDDKVEIVNWVMSCRVFRRDLEKFVMNTITNIARERGVNLVCGVYNRTERNGYIDALYTGLKFEECSDEGAFKLCLSKVDRKNFGCHIKGVENE